MLRIALLCCLLLLYGGVHAENEPYNRVDFQVEASRKVANDLLVASMSVTVQNSQPVYVAQQINMTLNNALRISASFSNVKVSSDNQRTYPVYGKNKQIEAWRGQGEIRLESRDFKAAGELIMQLQSSLQIGSLNFTLAPDTRRQTESVLVTEAIKAFQMRAEEVRAAVGMNSYKNVRFSINKEMPPQPFRVMQRAAPMAEMAIPEPEFAGGETHMTVQVSGTIELQ